MTLFGFARYRMALAMIICMGLSNYPAIAKQETQLAEIEFETLFIEISEEDSNFTVVDARMDETATAAVFFGVLGAGLTSAGNAAHDDKKADTLREAAAKIDLSSLLLDAMNQTFASSEDIAMASGQDMASHTLVVEIRNWGLLRKNKESQEMRSFLNLTLKIRDNKNEIIWEKKRENAVGDKSSLFEDYTEEKLTSEMEAVAEKTGRYIAYQFIYR